ncbi:hypothetical protein AB5I41_27165 [Sphingomonas sp. MMS24-JH45]
MPWASPPPMPRQVASRPAPSPASSTGSPRTIPVAITTLFQSPATVRVDYATGRVDIDIDLQGRELPFSAFMDVTVAGRQTATGTATLASDGVFQGMVSTPQGYTGSVRRQLSGSSQRRNDARLHDGDSTVEFAFGAAGLDAN